jgi:hypothetical protein
MYLPVLQDSRLYAFLLDVDRDLASRTHQSKCRFCGGVLHSACYLRKPRGLPAGVDPGPEFPVAFSFCCSVDGCRRRHTPPSVRFLGPKVYLAVMVALLTAMRQGPTPQSLRTLGARFGVDRRTLGRWRVWWQTIFPQSEFWRRAKARFLPPVPPADLPSALIERFCGESLLARIVAVLKFLSQWVAAF